MSTRNGSDRHGHDGHEHGGEPAEDPGSDEGLVETRIAGCEPLWRVTQHELPGPAPDRRAARPVLLVHAATLGRRMFAAPDGGFIAHLLRQKDGRHHLFAVYTVDWRSSNLLFGRAGDCLDDPRTAPADVTSTYRIDRVADEDIPAGVAAVAGLHPGRPIHLVAHCMGAAATAQAIASRRIGGAGQPPLGHVVLATIGLFYRLGVDGWLKVADNVVSELESDGVRFISPHVVFEHLRDRCRWQPRFEEMFDTWQRSVFCHGCLSPFCDRLWFMYGGDYRADDMMGLHDGDGPRGLTAHFGAMPIGLYRHIVENCRRGWAARWEAAGRPRAHELLDPDAFRGKDLTLITGAENQVWHRDSIDRMYEWLRRALPRTAATVRKRVFPRYGHVDLWWSSEAPREVFPYLTSLLREPLRPHTGASPGRSSTTARPGAPPGGGPSTPAP